MDFFDELGNFKKKEFTLQNVIFFYILQQQTHNYNLLYRYLKMTTFRSCAKNFDFRSILSYARL